MISEVPLTLLLAIATSTQGGEEGAYGFYVLLIYAGVLLIVSTIPGIAVLKLGGRLTMTVAVVAQLLVTASAITTSVVNLNGATNVGGASIGLSIGLLPFVLSATLLAITLKIPKSLIAISLVVIFASGPLLMYRSYQAAVALATQQYNEVTTATVWTPKGEAPLQIISGNALILKPSNLGYILQEGPDFDGPITSRAGCSTVWVGCTEHRTPAGRDLWTVNSDGAVVLGNMKIYLLAPRANEFVAISANDLAVLESMVDSLQPISIHYSYAVNGERGGPDGYRN
jgi:hypothetical protein